MLTHFLTGTYTHDLSNNAKNFVKRAFLLKTGYLSIHWFTQMFFILYILESLTFQELGILLSIQLSMTLIFDYPTGTIGDWVGQRWVISISTLFYTIFFLIFSIARSFEMFVLAFIILGLGMAQESGAFESWYENNYKEYVKIDEERKIFSYILGKQRTLSHSLQALIYFIGGLLVFNLSRSSLFFVQGLLSFIFIFLSIKYLEDHPNIKRRKPNFTQYSRLLHQGISFSVKNKTLRFFLIGSLIINIGIFMWGNFLLFPFYEDYTKTDEILGVLSSILFIFGAIFAWIGAIISAKISTNTSNRILAFSETFTIPLFICGVIIMSTFFPPLKLFNLRLLILLIGLFTFLQFLMQFNGILKNRLFLDLIPDKNRNSVYSLIPTITSIMILPTNIITGYLVDTFNKFWILLSILVITSIGGVIAGLAIWFYKPEQIFIPEDDIIQKINSPHLS
ncbi:MAG: MFS transporter [Candidatus Hodarchaeales archaeon]